MFGHKKKKDDEDRDSNVDIEGLKKRILGDSGAQHSPEQQQTPSDENVEHIEDTRPMPQHPQPSDQPQEHPRKKDLQHSPQVAHNQGPQENMVPKAPVFVKLEKYGNLLEEIAKVRSLIDHIKELQIAFERADHLKNEIVEKMSTAMAQMDAQAEDLETKFKKPEAPSVGFHRPKADRQEIDKVHNELEDLKRELEGLRG